MSDATIFLGGLLVALLCGTFLVITLVELRRIGRDAQPPNASDRGGR